MVSSPFSKVKLRLFFSLRPLFIILCKRNSAGQNNSNAPVAGRNSFTEGQAKSKIEDAGYTNVTELKKDDNGVWRGKASKSGSATAVSVDFQGNVNSAK